MGARRRWAFERGTLWVCEVAAAPPVPVAPRLGAVCGEVRREAMPTIEGDAWLDAAAVQRLAGGRRLFVARVDGQLAARAWVSRQREWVGELERWFELLPDEAYVWDCVTREAYRRQRLYSALLSHVLGVLRAEGVARVWIGAARANRPSLLGMANAGFRPAIDAVYGRLLAGRCLWVAGCPGAPAPLVAAARRLLAPRHERVIGPLVVGVARRLPSPASPECVR